MTPAPLVSIIIPCYRNEAYVAEAIDSALAQSYPNIEVIVIDDGSTDGSLDIIRSYAGRIIWRTGPNQGACAARNKGISLATGVFLKFLDSDDFLFPGAIRRQVERAVRLPEDSFVCGRAFRLNEADGSMVSHGCGGDIGSSKVNLKKILTNIPITSTMLYPRSLIKEVAGFEEGLVIRQDFDLFVRALIAGAKPVFTEDAVYCYRDHQMQARISRQPKPAIAEAQLKMFRRHVTLLNATGGHRQRPELAAALALAIWQSGRNVLRAGAAESAAEYFDLARRCSPDTHIHGRALYRALATVVGPMATEKLLVGIKDYACGFPRLRHG